MFLTACKAARVDRVFFSSLSMSSFVCTKFCKYYCLDTPFLQCFNSKQLEVLKGLLCPFLKWCHFSLWTLQLIKSRILRPDDELHKELFSMQLPIKPIICLAFWNNWFLRAFTKICIIMTLEDTGWRWHRNTVFAEKVDLNFFRRNLGLLQEW